MASFLLVAPRFVARAGEYYEFPLGLAYLSSALRKAGHEVSCLNLNHFDEPLVTTLWRALAGAPDDLVLASGGLSVHFDAVRRIFETARTLRPGLVTVAGGGLVSSEPELMLGALNCTYGAVGEGEETLVGLAGALSGDGRPEEVRGLVLRDGDGKPFRTPERPPIKDLDRLAFPDYEGFDLPRYLDLQRTNDCYYLYPVDRPRAVPVISSRSCPYHCDFCFHPLGRKYRSRSLDSFFEEIGYLVRRHGVNLLAIVDELFSEDRDRMEEFCRRIRARGLKWLVQLRVHPVDRELLQLLRDSGCCYISFGLESMHPAVLASMRKQVTPEQIERALALAYEVGIGIQGNFIFGDRAETAETASVTLAWWRRHPQYQVNLTHLIPYPGSELYLEAVQKGKIPDRLSYISSGCPTINLTALPDPEFHRMQQRVNRETYSPDRMVFAGDTILTPEGNDPLKGPLYRVAFRCARCRAENRIPGYNLLGFRLGGALPVLHCRACHQRQMLFRQEETAEAELARLPDPESRQACLAAWSLARGNGQPAPMVVGTGRVSPLSLAARPPEQALVIRSSRHQDFLAQYRTLSRLLPSSRMEILVTPGAIGALRKDLPDARFRLYDRDRFGPDHLPEALTSLLSDPPGWWVVMAVSDERCGTFYANVAALVRRLPAARRLYLNCDADLFDLPD